MEKTFYNATQKVIPNQTQLSQLERRLRFHPSPVIQPQTLTKAQVEGYNRAGYVKGVRIFDEQASAAHRRFFDEILARTLAGGGNSYSIISAHIKYGPVYDLLTHPRIVACVQDILGDEIVGWGAHFFCKLPHDPKIVSWHQDASFWPLTPSKTVTVWLAIDDADRENACMKFIAGSHHLGHLTYRMSEDADNSVLNQTVENPEQFGEVIYDELRAGEISLHSDLLLHSSEANRSDRRRCGLTLRYCTTDVRSDASFGWNREGVVIRGQDPSGHWANPPRPM
jgi:non-haem Fe2+, alpha-ketoglutarate-dependent halogenase